MDSFIARMWWQLLQLHGGDAFASKEWQKGHVTTVSPYIAHSLAIVFARPILVLWRFFFFLRFTFCRNMSQWSNTWADVRLMLDILFALSNSRALCRTNSLNCSSVCPFARVHEPWIARNNLFILAYILLKAVPDPKNSIASSCVQRLSLWW